MPNAFQIHVSDSVAVLLDDAHSDETVHLFGGSDGGTIIAREGILLGHKIAIRSHAPGETVTKYGVDIGHAISPIAPGDWVHLHNCASDLDERSNTLEVISGAPTDTPYE